LDEPTDVVGDKLVVDDPLGELVPFFEVSTPITKSTSMSERKRKRGREERTNRA
jgi:hypothetical protein